MRAWERRRGLGKGECFRRMWGVPTSCSLELVSDLVRHIVVASLPCLLSLLGEQHQLLWWAWCFFCLCLVLLLLLGLERAE